LVSEEVDSETAPSNLDAPRPRSRRSSTS
jgi:hypothetical protein